MKKFFAGVVSLVLLGIVTGCVSLPDYRPDLPEDIGNDGLVVGQVVGVGRLWGWSHGYQDVLINDRKKGKLIKGFIAIPLSPGEYNLTGLYSETYSTTGSMTYRYMTTLPVKRSFTIRPKEVTNLGLIVLYPDPTDKEQKKFMRFFIDNTTDMKHFLKTYYPGLSSKLKTDSMTLAQGDLLPENLIEALRKEIAIKEAIAAGGHAMYVAGDAGTLAEIQKDKDGKISGVKLIDIPTVSSIQSVSQDDARARLAFLTSNNRFFYLKDGRVSEKRPPATLRAGQVYALGTNDLVIVDDRFEIYTSHNNGDSWHTFLGAVIQGKADTRHAAAGKSGFYLYNDYPIVMLYSQYGSAQYQPVALPEDVKSLRRVTEKGSGLFVEKQITMWTKNTPNPFFVRPAGKTAWETRQKPNASCGNLAFLDDEGMSLSVQCDKETFLSKDGGRTWQKK